MGGKSAVSRCSEASKHVYNNQTSTLHWSRPTLQQLLPLPQHVFRSRGKLAWRKKYTHVFQWKSFKVVICVNTVLTHRNFWQINNRGWSVGSAPRGYRVKQPCHLPQNLLALLTTHVIHCLIDGLLFSGALNNSLIFNQLKLSLGMLQVIVVSTCVHSTMR